MKNPDNIIIHHSQNSPLIVHALINYRSGSKILFRAVAKDVDVALAVIERQGFGSLPCKVYNYK